MKYFYFLLLVLLMGGCLLENSYNFEYDIIVTDYATNLTDLNSPYDDYNSDLPYPGQRMEIYFSSNRSSAGRDFDFVGGLMDFSYHEKDDVIDIHIPGNADVFSVPEIILQESINTDANEFGPYTYRAGNENLFLYGTGEEGDFAIKLVEIPSWGYNAPEEEKVAPEPVPLAKINEEGDNLYPSIGSNNRELFFCSNRSDSVFNIYSAHYSTPVSRQSLTTGEELYKIERNEALSSPYDDKCPYVKGSLMVFASNRPGGHGGYDLWYSRLENNEWSKPDNLGDKINSAHDEFRPVPFSILQNVLKYDLMIFSSNRPGGKGGFDLYVVKLDGLSK